MFGWAYIDSEPVGTVTADNRARLAVGGENPRTRATNLFVRAEPDGGIVDLDCPTPRRWDAVMSIPPRGAEVKPAGVELRPNSNHGSGVVKVNWSFGRPIGRSPNLGQVSLNVAVE